LWRKNSGKIVMISKRSISKIQKSFRWIDDDRLPFRVDFNHDRICQWYQSFFATAVGYDHNLGSASFKNRVDLADDFRSDLDGASFQFPVVIMIGGKRKRFRLGNGEFKSN